MKAEELRIGNLIGMDLNFNPQNIYFVDEVAYDAMKTFDCGMNCNRSGEVGYHDAVHFEPIPLTEEWLFKFGFVNTDEGEYFKDWKCGGLKIRYKKQNEKYIIGLWTDSDDDCQIIWLDYVHQLQNIYFMVNRKELKLKRAQENESI